MDAQHKDVQKMWKERIDMIGIWNWFKEINFLCILGIHKYDRLHYMFDINKEFKMAFPDEAKFLREEKIVPHFWWECERCGTKRRDYNGEKVEW